MILLSLLLLRFFWFSYALTIDVETTLYIKMRIPFYFKTISIRNVFHDYHVKLCHKLHELFELPQGLLTLDYVVHASVIRIDVSIDVYCFTRLSVLWNKPMLHRVHGQSLWSVHTTYAYVHTNLSIHLYCQVNRNLSCT